MSNGCGRQRGPPFGPGVGEPSLTWDRRTEAFYSAWIERLFDAPASEAVSFPALQDALRDESRNFLYNHLQLGEDDPRSRTALTATPDCADCPTFSAPILRGRSVYPSACARAAAGRRVARHAAGRLRSWSGQAGVPTRSRLSRPTRAGSWTPYNPGARVRRSATKRPTSIRCRLARDFAPRRRLRRSLRPHVLVVKWVAQTPEQGGLLLAVDAQPDNSVGRKRFWEGTFLFTNDTASAGRGSRHSGRSCGTQPAELEPSDECRRSRTTRAFAVLGRAGTSLRGGVLRAT